MKFTIFLALALAAFYVAQAEPIPAKDAQELAIEQEQDNPSPIQELSHLRRLKRANCSTLRCAAFCARKRLNGICSKGDSQPVKEEALQDYVLGEADQIADQAVAEHSRQKRATCDLLSKWNWNHTACAAHCLARGNKGGYCNDKAVCVCRR